MQERPHHSNLHASFSFLQLESLAAGVLPLYCIPEKLHLVVPVNHELFPPSPENGLLWSRYHHF